MTRKPSEVEAYRLLGEAFDIMGRNLPEEVAKWREEYANLVFWGVFGHERPGTLGQRETIRAALAKGEYATKEDLADLKDELNDTIQRVCDNVPTRSQVRAWIRYER